jgi:hypothetical protein
VNDCRTVGTTGLFGKHSYSVCEMFAWPLWSFFHHSHTLLPDVSNDTAVHTRCLLVQRLCSSLVMVLWLKHVALFYMYN